MRALIADDHPVFRGALKAIILSIRDGAEIVEAADYAGLAARMESAPFDLVLVDLIMPGSGGLSSIIELVQLAGTAKLVVVSGMESPDIIERVRRCGVAGYIAKSTPPEGIATAIDQILAGATIFPPAAAARQPGEAADRRFDALTPKQLQVLKGLAKGLSNKELAAQFGLSPNTVKIHVTDVLRKLGVSSRSQAIAVALERWQDEPAIATVE
jgi:DNA-binding NarL/FixJ family response regulator